MVVSNDAGGVDVFSCMGIEDADGVGGVMPARVLCSWVVGGRGKFESGWSRVAGVARVVGVVGIGGEMARFESGWSRVARVVGVAGVAGIGGEMARFVAESLARVARVVRVVGVVEIGVLFSENGVPVN